MKIVIAIGSSDFFGAERRLLKIIRNLLDRPGVFCVLLINSTLMRRSKASPLAEGVIRSLSERGQLVVIPDRPSHLFELRGFKEIPKILFGREYSVHTILRARVLAYFRALINLPAVIEVTSPDIARRIALEAPTRALLKMRRFVCVSSTVSKTLEVGLRERKIPLRPGQIVTAASGFYEPPEVSPVPKERILVSASRFIPRKNVRILSEAIKLAAPSIPDWRFEVLGQGEEEDIITENMSELISDGRAFVGYTADVSGILNRSAIYVSLIEPDNYPSQSVLEAMSLGNAILVSDTGESTERFIGDGGNGRSVAIPLRPTAIAERIVSMCSDFSACIDMGAKSREVVDRRYSAQSFIDEMLSFHRHSD